jgi:uncharacterized lipoprotein YajG
MRRDKTDAGRRSALLIATMVVLTGCSITPRPTFIEVVPERAAASASDTRERAVYIRVVNDLRQFTLNASVPQAPSLSSVTALDPKQTATAVAQIRTAAGTVFADVFLKDGKTAAALIKDATADAFSRAGYRVVESASAPTDIPVDVDILQFWAYNTGSWTFKFTAVIETQIRSDVPAIAPDNKISNTLSLQSAVAASPTSFRNTVTKALEKYTQDLSAELTKKR